MPFRGDPACPAGRLNDSTIARLRSLLVRAFERRTRDAELVKDLVQESLVHVVSGVASRRSGTSVDAWARRIGLNVWHDHLRRLAARPGERTRTATAELLDTLPASASALTSEETHDRRTTQECLLHATRQLPIAGRRVLLLCEFGDMSIADAAHALGCSPAAAKVRLHRARRQLTELCRAQCQCEGGGGGAPVCTPMRPARRAATATRHRPRLR